MIRRNRRELFVDKIGLILDVIFAFTKHRGAYKLKYKKRYSGAINILGTGPSLKDSISYVLHTKDPNVALNDFAMSDLYKTIKPRYYIFLDSAYFSSSDSITKRDLENREKVFDSISKNTDWKMEIIVPSSMYSRNLLRDSIQNEHISFIPVKFSPLRLVDTTLYYRVLEKNYAASFQNVLAAAVYVVINLGYDEIRLFGAEHSWTEDLRVNDKNQVCTIYKHFYEEDGKLIPWMMANNEPDTMEHLLYSLHKTFRAYNLLYNYACMHNCRVLNYTPNSFIDAFERKTMI